MKQSIMYIFTRTPLHVGAGSSVGAIDQPVQRERHTDFPIIPASALKGVLADEWKDALENGKRGKGDAAWLFGSDDPIAACAGSVQFSEARLLAFPVRSAKGCFAWITSPLVIDRFARDIGKSNLSPVGTISDEEVVYAEKNAVDLGGKIVLEEYALTRKENANVSGMLFDAIRAIMPDDEVWQRVTDRLVVVSDGMMSFFARNACEVAQHIRIDDETGTVAQGALFNQENVPSETMFYSTISFFDGRNGNGKSAKDAATAFAGRVNGKVMQFGGDASTGLGFCSVVVQERLP
jgi:CRISPR-associated protein Cmr4